MIMVRRKNSMKNIIKVIIGVLVIWLAIHFIYPYFLSDETKIRKIIAETSERTAGKDIFRFMKHFHDDYKDDSALSKGDIQGIALRIFKMYEKIEVTCDIKKIVIKGKKAHILLDLSVIVPTKKGDTDLIFIARETNAFNVKMKKHPWFF